MPHVCRIHTATSLTSTSSIHYYCHCRYSRETASLPSSPLLGGVAAVLLLFHSRFP